MTTTVSNSKVGVLTLRPPNSTSYRVKRILEELKKTQILCDHNESVCLSLGETEKAETWSLLKEAVKNHSEEYVDCNNGFDQGGNLALGCNLTESVLGYYESKGDVQMVSTIVCVLGGGRRNQEKHTQILSLLPPSHVSKFDLHIQRYADMLFSWGLLTKRAELNKHLVRNAAQLEGNQVLALGETGQSPGMGIALRCHRCGDKVRSTSNLCSSCGGYALRCIICDHAVRGLVSLCPLCG